MSASSEFERALPEVRDDFLSVLVVPERSLGCLQLSFEHLLEGVRTGEVAQPEVGHGAGVLLAESYQRLCIPHPGQVPGLDSAVPRDLAGRGQHRLLKLCPLPRVQILTTGEDVGPALPQDAHRPGLLQLGVESERRRTALLGRLRLEADESRSKVDRRRSVRRHPGHHGVEAPVADGDRVRQDEGVRRHVEPDPLCGEQHPEQAREVARVESGDDRLNVDGQHSVLPRARRTRCSTTGSSRLSGGSRRRWPNGGRRGVSGAASGGGRLSTPRRRSYVSRSNRDQLSVVCASSVARGQVFSYCDMAVPC